MQMIKTKYSSKVSIVKMFSLRVEVVDGVV
jgi:hypothetical protein